MLCLLSSLLGSWFIISLALILYIVLGKPSRFLLDLNPIYFRAPLPNVNDTAYRRNRRVVQCDKVHTDRVTSPKSVTSHPDGRIFTGSTDGNVYCLPPGGQPELLHSFPNGRPLGLRLLNDKLYLIEAMSGLYCYDLQRRCLEQLLTLDETKFLDGRPSKFFDDLAVVAEENGNTVIYITDVSRKFSIDMWCYTYLEPDSTGRILKYDLNSKCVTVILENLCFPNGIEVTRNNQSLLICELAKRRIVQHTLKGSNAGETTVLIDNLPGEPENIRQSLNRDKETYWIGLALTRDYRNQLSFLDDYATEPNLRKLILRSCYLLGSMLSSLGNVFNNKVLQEKGQNLQTGLALILSDFMTNPGMALEIDLESNILMSLQVKNDVSVISEIMELPTNDGTRLLYTTSSGGNLGKITLTN